MQTVERLTYRGIFGLQDVVYHPGEIMNKFTALVLCLVLCLSGTIGSTSARVSAADTVVSRIITLTIGSKILGVDDAVISIEASPQIRSGRSFAPVASIVRALDGAVRWNSTSRKATIVLDGRTMLLTIGSRYAVVNGKQVSIDSDPDLVPYVQAPGRVMVPVRFIAQQFGAVVTWNSTLQQVTLTLNAANPPLSLVTQGVAQFRMSDTRSTFLTLLANESVDVIEMASGTYHLRYMVININRTRPIVIRPAAGATVILSGAGNGHDPQFGFGFGGTAGNITMEGLIFDGYILGQQGIIQVLDCHDIILNDMVVRNSRADPAIAEPYNAWAVYLSSTSTVHATRFTANRWNVDGSDHQMGALQVYGGDHVTATGWSVSNAYYAVYASSCRGPLTNFILSGWNISNTGAPAWQYPDAAVAVEDSSGWFSNMSATGSGALLNAGNPKMTDGGGNSISVMPLVCGSTHTFR
jgi:hypothetical protein